MEYLNHNLFCEVNDKVANFFRSFGYLVSWDFKKRTNEYWYEIGDRDNRCFCQVDMGVPLEHIIEDFTAIHNGKDTTSPSNYKICAKLDDPKFKILIEKVAQFEPTL